MATEIILRLEGYEQDVIFSVKDKTIIIQNTATNATHFYFGVGAADWEQVKKFVNEQLEKT